MALIFLPEGANYPASNITAANAYSQMGLTDGGATTRTDFKGSPPASKEYFNRGYMTMGIHPHGQACPQTYIDKLNTAAGGTSYWSNNYWDYGAPWIAFDTLAVHSTTNSRLIVSNMQCLILRKSTGKWVDLYESAGYLTLGMNWYNMDFTSYSQADAVVTNDACNLPGFNIYSNIGGRGSSDLDAGYLYYRSLHNSAYGRKPLPGGGVDCGGVFITCLVKIVPEPGNTVLNGVTKIYGTLGFDFIPNESQQETAGDFALNGYWPASGQSTYTLIPSDGSWVRLYYIPYRGAGAFLNTGSPYYTTYGADYMCLTAAQIEANPPILVPNSPFKKTAKSNHVLIPPLAGIAHEINGVLASTEAQTVMRQSFTDGGALLSAAVKAALPDTGMPVVESVTETIFAVDATAHAVFMPATVNAGDCLIAFVTVDGAPVVTTPTGWKRFYSNANSTALKGAMYAKVATGTEGGTTVNFVTDSAENMAVQVFRISNWNGTLAGIQVGVSAQTSTGSTVDLPAVTFYWGSSKTLCIGVCHSSTTQTVSSAPTNYTNLLRTSSADATIGAQVITARRNVTASSEDPEVFTFSSTGASKVYNTVVIAPANAGLYYEHFNITSGLNTLWLGMYVSQSTTTPDTSITRAIIVNHGSSLAPDEYGNVVRKNMENYLGKAIIVAPFWAESSNWPETDQIYWGSSIWPELGNSSGSLAFTVSSGTVLDSLIARLYSTFVNLEGVVIVGHSAGGQLTNRYSAASSDTRNRYLVSAASSYMYLDGKRANGFGGWETQTSPADYDDWKYGLAHLATAASTYVQAVGVYNLRNNLLNAKVTYMVGALDNDIADTSMDTSSEAALQGSQRVERQSNYYKHIQYYYGYIV